MTGAGEPLLASSARAHALLGWRETNPQTALQESVDWHLEHACNETDDAERFAAGDDALRNAE
jgi:hypothetical protein